MSLNDVKQIIFVKVKSHVLFAVRAEFLNIIETSFSFRAFMCRPLTAFSSFSVRSLVLAKGYYIVARS
jgi:hypothetical protein